MLQLYNVTSQVALDEAIKKRLKMITRQVNEVKSVESQIQLVRRQLDGFDRMYGMGGSHSPSVPAHNIFEKDFECPVCYEVMSPPSRIFQCNNGHLICEECKCHSEIRTCPTCRVPLGPTSLLRNIPMEKLAKTYFERCSSNSRSASRNTEQEQEQEQGLSPLSSHSSRSADQQFRRSQNFMNLSLS